MEVDTPQGRPSGGVLSVRAAREQVTLGAEGHLSKDVIVSEDPVLSVCQHWVSPGPSANRTDGQAVVRALTDEVGVSGADPTTGVDSTRPVAEFDPTGTSRVGRLDVGRGHG